MAEDHQAEAIPADLNEAPSGEVSAPPIETRGQLLPVEGLRWDDFEKLCLRVARLEGDPRRSRRYGVPGQAQGGIDLYSALSDGGYATYQCKKYEELTAGDIRDAVDEFLRGPWAGESRRFVLCTSASAVRTQLADEVEKQRKRLASREQPIEFEILDADELSLTLKSHRDIVVDFFGSHWADWFLGPDAAGLAGGAEVRDMFEELLGRTGGFSQFITNEWAPESLQPKLDEFRRDDPEGFARLNALVGNPPEEERLREAVDSPPRWLVEAGDQTWDILARTCEVSGEWCAASDAWVNKAERLTDYPKAGALVQAATAAGVSGNAARREELLQRAAGIAPEHARLALERLDEQARPTEKLEVLNELDAEDPEERALIAAHKTLAYILTPDLDAAEACLAQVCEYLPHSALTKGLGISLTVQHGRIAVMSGRPLDRAALEAAAATAQEVREELIKARRWLESTRLLMLAADVAALLWDRAAASRILHEALDGEKSTTEQKIVLAASASGRALDYELALEILGGADDTPETKLIRFEALEEVGLPQERETALAGLDQLVRDGGRQAPEAAFARLAATIGPRPTSWSEEAADYLKAHGHEKAAVTAEAYYRVKEEGFEAAEQVLEPYSQPWALAVRVRIALRSDAPREAAIAAAEELLAVGPSHLWRVEAGRAFARGRHFDRAREVLIGVAREPGAPQMVRADAYELLMGVVGNDLDGWELAAELHGEWVKLKPADSRLPKWAPRIASRLPREER